MPSSVKPIEQAIERRAISPLRIVKRWWRMHVTKSVDQDFVVEDLREDSYMSPRYYLMTAMSAGIAILGMILSSPAVVIGAMLLSPLLGPIMGSGMSLAIGDYEWMKQSAKALLVGTLLAIIFSALIVFLSPLQTMTPEIAARTRPNLFDLLVALFSAIAGAYAMIRKLDSSIVGVAIATALMPPLAAIGYGLATLNWTAFGGASLLYVTNLTTIALTMALMARLYGFRTMLSERATMVKYVAIVVTFVALAIPLSYSLRQIAWEANASRIVKSSLEDQFSEKARVSQIDISFGSRPIQVNASVLTPKFEAEAAGRVKRDLNQSLGTVFEVNIDQFRVGTGAGDADAAQIAAAKAQEQAIAEERKLTQLVERLALVAGVEPQDVLIDRANRRAVVKAKPLQGAALETYYELEARVAALEPDWQLLIEPPALPLPPIAMANEELSEEGKKAFELISWAAKRIGTPIGINGSDSDVAALKVMFKEKQVEAMRKKSLPSRRDIVSTGWIAPDERED